jgi:hypothetical protein
MSEQIILVSHSYVLLYDNGNLKYQLNDKLYHINYSMKNKELKIISISISENNSNSDIITLEINKNKNLCYKNEKMYINGVCYLYVLDEKNYKFPTFEQIKKIINNNKPEIIF